MNNFLIGYKYKKSHKHDLFDQCGSLSSVVRQHLNFEFRQVDGLESCLWLLWLGVGNLLCALVEEGDVGSLDARRDPDQWETRGDARRGAVTIAQVTLV